MIHLPSRAGSGSIAANGGAGGEAGGGGGGGRIAIYYATNNGFNPASMAANGGAAPSGNPGAAGTTGVASSNIYDSGDTTATSETVPTSAAKLYMRLGQRINGLWQQADYTYTEQ